MEKFEDSVKIEMEAKQMMTAATQIQVKLIEKSRKEGEDRLNHGLEWINKNATLFRKVFDGLVSDHPELVSEWDPSKHVTATESGVEIEDTPEREKIIKMILERMDEVREEKLDKAA